MGSQEVKGGGEAVVVLDELEAARDRSRKVAKNSFIMWRRKIERDC